LHRSARRHSNVIFHCPFHKVQIFTDKDGHATVPLSAPRHASLPRRAASTLKSPSRLLASPTNPAVPCVSQPPRLARPLRLSRRPCLPPHQDGRARWMPLSTSVLSGAVLIMAGGDWEISGPTGIPTGGAGASASVGAASSTFWRPRARRFMAGGSRLKCWGGEWERWPRG
jgi:hypothetical protein